MKPSLKEKLWRVPKPWYFLGLPLGALLFFIIGFFATATFNGVMAYTNSNEFCYSCHIGMDTIVEEYQESVHYSKVKGVAKATCADCHVPKEFFPKMYVKIRATKDVYHMLAGTITLDNFESHRGHLAEDVWEIMHENDSQACRNCHKVNEWDLSQQAKRARKKHDPEYMKKKDKSCIDCHQGIAHELPEYPEEDEESEE